jgi:hypothetical protein
MIDDQERFIASKSLDFLAETGEAEKYGPILLEHLERAEGEHFGRLGRTLAQLGYGPALPIILAYVEQDDKKVSLNEYLSLISALGKFGGDEARQALWKLFDQEAQSSSRAVPALMDALLEVAQPEDISRLIQAYRALPRSNDKRDTPRFPRTPLSTFASIVQTGRLVDEMGYEIDEGLGAMLERAEWWLDAELQFSETCFDDLEHAFDNKYEGLFEILLREAQHLFEERGDDLTGWQAAWEAGERPIGYRQRSLYTWLILKGFADQPKTYLTRRQQESILGLGLLAQLSVASDDQARLEAATDKIEALLAILTESREHVLPDIVERVVALGPEVAPRLIDLLDPENFGWATIRIARVIERMARAYPGSCDGAVPKLIACIHEEQGDLVKEAASDALEAIGPPAVELINEHLRRTRDMSREIYLTGVLGEIPVESATEVILAKIEAGKSIGEMEIMALSDIGSASAIEPLYQLWKPGDRLLTKQLLILCELNGVQKPELSEWRRIAEAENERINRLMSEDPAEQFDPLEALAKLASGGFPAAPTWQLEKKQPGELPGRSKKAVSKKTKKKRVAQRKGPKGKKKKRKRR